MKVSWNSVFFTRTELCCGFPCWSWPALQWACGWYIQIPCYYWIVYQIKRLIFPIATLQENLTKNFTTMEFSKLTKIEVPHGEDLGGSAVSKKPCLHIQVYFCAKAVQIPVAFLRIQCSTVSIKDSSTLTYVNIKKK